MAPRTAADCTFLILSLLHFLNYPLCDLPFPASSLLLGPLPWPDLDKAGKAQMSPRATSTGMESLGAALAGGRGKAQQLTLRDHWNIFFIINKWEMLLQLINKVVRGN